MFILSLELNVNFQIRWNNFKFTSLSHIKEVNPNCSLFRNNLSISLFKSSIEFGDLLDRLDRLESSSMGELNRELTWLGWDSTSLKAYYLFQLIK